MDKVLVLDCWTRKGLAMARALGSQNLEVHTASHKRINSARFSKFSSKFIYLPNPEKNADKYGQEVLKLVIKENYSCIFPLEEVSIKALYRVKGNLEKHTSYPLVEENKFDIAHDKWKTLQIAEKLKIPLPQSYLPKNLSDAQKLANKISFPLIIKARKSSGSRGVKKVNNLTEFTKHYSSISNKYGLPIIQEFVSGNKPGVLCAFLVNDKKILADFSYERLREYPVSGGPGTLWVSTDNEIIKEYGAKLLKEMGWKGIALVEFKYDSKSKKFKLMEINPRFWGSLSHSFYSGVNFPYLLFLVSQGKKFPKPKYKIGVKCRWLIPGDVLHFISNPKRLSLKPSFFNFKGTYFDDLTLMDIPGSIGSLLSSLIGILDIEIWKKGIFRK